MVVPDTSRQEESPEDEVLQPGDEDERSDSIIISKFDSLAVVEGWGEIKPADPDACFQKQYAGYIGNKKTIVNINLRAINIRGDKDIVMWLAMGDTLIYAYFGEASIFGETQSEHWGGQPICKNCRTDSLVLHARYILGGAGSPIAIRFSKDSTKLYGLYYNPVSHATTSFSLSPSTPSLALNYITYRFHKHQKWKGDEVAEVPATVVFAANLPDSSSLLYKTFLLDQAGVVLDTAKPVTIEKVAAAYKKVFLSREKESHTDYARSMIGGYEINTVIYNQDSFAVTTTESFTGNAEDYGDMGSGFLSYDIKAGKFWDEDEVMIKDWDHSKNIENLRNIFQTTFRGFAFVCPQGIAFRVRGNHGWEVDLYFVKWKLIKPFIQSKFIQQHAAWFK